MEAGRGQEGAGASRYRSKGTHHNSQEVCAVRCTEPKTLEVVVLSGAGTSSINITHEVLLLFRVDLDPDPDPPGM